MLDRHVGDVGEEWQVGEHEEEEHYGKGLVGLQLALVAHQVLEPGH